jgi:hypothetical protein
MFPSPFRARKNRHPAVRRFGGVSARCDPSGCRLRAVHDTPLPRVHGFAGPAVLSARLQPSDHFRGPDLVSHGGLAQFAVSPLADAVMALAPYRDHGASIRSLAIINARSNSHDLAMRQFSIGPGGISLVEAVLPGST